MNVPEFRVIVRTECVPTNRTGWERHVDVMKGTPSAKITQLASVSRKTLSFVKNKITRYKNVYIRGGRKYSL